MDRWDEDADDYIGHYEVFRLPSLTKEQVAGSWVGLEALAIEQLPDIGLRELPFEVPLRGSPEWYAQGLDDPAA